MGIYTQKTPPSPRKWVGGGPRAGLTTCQLGVPVNLGGRLPGRIVTWLVEHGLTWCQLPLFWLRQLVLVPGLTRPQDGELT